MKQRKSTNVEMVTELEKMHPYPEVKEMIAEAKAGEYHDFKNVKYDCGKVESLRRLRLIGQLYPGCQDQAVAISKDIMEGNYDETMDEEDKKRMAEGLSDVMKKSLGLEDY